MQLNERGFFPAEPESKIAVGLDIGYSNDNSVAVTVERLRLPIPPEQDGIGADLVQKLGPPLFIVRGVVIFPLRTPFGHVIEHCKAIQAALDRDARIIVDATGQLSFAEQARNAGLVFTQLSITGGNFDSVSFRNGKQNVSKSALVAAIDACLTAGELLIPNDLPGCDQLVTQLRAFAMGRSPITGQAVWTGKRAHDDCVMALSYALHVLRERGSHWAVQTFLA